MIDIAVYNKEGKEIDSLKVDEAILGGSVRYPLLKQAIVMYHANKRVGTAANKDRGMVAGSNKKLFRQKGTGNARIGNARTGKRVGGGVTFVKTARDFGKDMPKKQRRLAKDSAILAKMLSKNVIVIDNFDISKPCTSEFVSILNNLNIDRSCLVTIDTEDVNLYKSARNVRKIYVRPVAQLNAGEICSVQKMLFTKDSLLTVLNRDKTEE